MAIENVILKQLKNNDVIMQVICSKPILTLGEEITNFHTDQLKKNRNYNVILSGKHLKTS